jgi:hypothetical protein
LLRWLIIVAIFLIFFLLFLLEFPSLVLSFAKGELGKQGISYSSMEGGLLSGFKVKGLNYQNQIKIKELDLKVDWGQLEERVLYVEHLKVEEMEIDRAYLRSLLDNNSSNDDESNISLPFDKIVLNQVDIGLQDIVYDAYKINHATIKIDDFSSDMREKHKGDIQLALDSNVTQLQLDGSIDNDFVKLLAEVELNRVFINPFIVEQNLSLTSNPLLTLKIDGNLKKVNYHLDIHRLGLKQNEYEIDGQKLILFGNYSIPQKDVEVTLNTELRGSMAYLKLQGDAKLNLDDLNDTLDYRVDTTITPKADFLSQVLADQNITFLDAPIVHLRSAGGMQKLDYNLSVQQLFVSQNAYTVKSNDLLLYGDYGVIDKGVVSNIKMTLDSNIAWVKLDGNTGLDLNDLNDTLQFNLSATVQPKKEFVESKIPDKNLTIEHVADVKIMAGGTLQDTKFKVDFQGLKVKRGDIDVEVKSLGLVGDTNPLGGDTVVNIITDFDSTVGGGRIEDRVTLNFNRAEQTLQYGGDIDVVLHKKYINRFLKEHKVEIENEPKVSIRHEGDTEKISLTVKSVVDLIKEKARSKLTISGQPILINFKKSSIDGSLDMHNSSKIVGFDLKSSFSGDYTNLAKLKVDTKMNIKSFNLFGINLNPIMPLDIKVENSDALALFRIESDAIKLSAQTKDKDHFIFNLKTQNLYLYKMIELPKELDHKFLRFDLSGWVTLSTEFFLLNGTVDSNQKFRSKISADNGKFGLDAKVKSEELLLTLQGDLKEKSLEAEVEIESLMALQQEFNRLYAFKKVDVDGALDAKIKLKGEEIWGRVDSSKLVLSGFDINALLLDAHYRDELLTINKLGFETAGFDDKKLNKKVYLNQPGKIYLGERRDVLLDIHPDIFIKAEGDTQSLDAQIKIAKLPLGHPDYGSMFLNCDIDYQQRGEDKVIEGLIDIRKMKLFYEAKFLNADYDPDVIIIDKKRQKKSEKSEDSFLKHTRIDLKIKVPKANYRTADIDLQFDINLKADKQFGEELALLGKVEEINGRVDQVPKRFQVKSSNIVFKGGKKINPLLDIRVEYVLPQVLIKIGIGGNATHPRIEFSSEPPMPKKDIMSYLLLGVSTANLKNNDGSLGREAELFILNQAARDLAYEMEFDRIFIKDDGTGEGYAVEVGKKINEKNMFIIESSKEGNSFILERDISKHIKIRVGQHQKEQPSKSIDIYFRKRFK